MSERSHQENLYVLLRNAKGGQQAKKMHGATDPLTPDHSKEGIRTEDATIVHDRLSGGTGGGGVGDGRGREKWPRGGVWRGVWACAAAEWGAGGSGVGVLRWDEIR